MNIMKPDLNIDTSRVLAGLNVALTVTALLLLTGVCMNLTYPRAALMHRNSLALRIQKAQARAQQKAAAGLPAFDEELFRQKNLFNAPLDKKDPGLAKEFILTGVSVGAHSLAVIRDPLTGKTYYCTEGDSIDDYRVRTIARDSVILESGRGLLEIHK